VGGRPHDAIHRRAPGLRTAVSGLGKERTSAHAPDNKALKLTRSAKALASAALAA
jgi:hypothetical protein